MKKGIIRVGYPFLTLILVLSLVLISNTSVFASGLRVFSGETSSNSESFVPGEILIKFKHGIPQGVIDRINIENGVSTLQVSPRGLMRAGIPKNKSVEQMVAVYSHNPNVEYTQPNFICQAIGFPTDPLYPNDQFYNYQWNLDNPEYGGINMEGAWAISDGSGVTVAVVDTGIAYKTYTDSTGQEYLQAPDLANTNFVDGYDFINNDLYASDDNSHGTHVAGTIAQSTNNGIGVAGIAYGATLMPVKVLDADGSGTVYSLVDGIEFAADNGANVINMSLSFGYSFFGWPVDPGMAVQDAVSYAYNQGVTLVASAGNEGGGYVDYPAAYTECIAVGASQRDESRSSYSNYGSALDLTAPGGDDNDWIWQETFNPNTQDPSDFGIWGFQGTSMASPHVAGVAALLISAGINDPDNVRQVLQSTAEDHGASGWDSQYGWGIVDAFAALSSLGPINQPPIADAGEDQTATVGDTVSFDGSGSYDPDGSIVSYSWSFGDGETGSGEIVSHTYTAASTYTARLTVTDNLGGTDTDTATVTVSPSPGSPDFSIGITLSSQTVLQGSSVDYTVTITPTNGFNGAVDLNVSGLPSGASGFFDPNPVTPPDTTTSTLTVSTTSGIENGTYTLTVSGTSDPLIRTTNCTLVVVGNQSFTLDPQPGSQTVRRNSFTSYAIGILPSGGFDSPVTLIVSGLPRGSSAAFYPNPLIPDQDSEQASLLLITTSRSTKTGEYTLTITGTGGGITDQATVTLKVTK